MSKRIISIILTFALIFSCCPVWVYAAEETACTLEVPSVYAAPGSTVEVSLNIEGNPGVLGATLTVSWDTGLTLVDSKNGEAFSELTMVKPSRLQSGCKFVWYSTDTGDIIDGPILKLYFAVPENARDADTYGIRVSYDKSDIADANGDPGNITLNIKNGAVQIITYIPGDVNSDSKINPTDLVTLAKYISDGCVTDPEGYNVAINESAADVNDDGKINPSDLVNMAKYISDGCVTDPDGYNVVLKPSTPKCSHTMEAKPYKAATCEEAGNVSYFYCTTCNKYYNDSNGSAEISVEDTVLPKADHTPVKDPYVEPTYDSTGLTEGSHCSACGEVLVAQKEIPKLEKTTVTVTYHYEGLEQDSYLTNYVKNNQVEKHNPNSAEFNTAQKGYTLKALNNNAVPGYKFLGWVDGYGNPVTSIAKGDEGHLDIYADWQIITYWVTFKSPDVPATNIPVYDYSNASIPTDSVHYTVASGLNLDNHNPAWYGYTFVGWSNSDGFLTSEIKPGTTGDITVQANWTANRNIATSYRDYGDPIIIEDAENGQFLFVYNIGKIDNVPLNEIPGSYFHNMDVTEFSESLTISNAVNSEMVDGINKMISNATTRSSGWTLSSEWNDMYTSKESVGTLQEKSDERTTSEGQVVGGKYFVSNSAGGSTYVSNESGGSTFNSSKVTTDESMGINGSYDKSKEKYCDAQLGIKTHLGGSAGVGAEAGVAVPIPIGVGTAGVNGSVTVDGSIDGEAGIQNGRKDKSAFHIDGSYSKYTGTVDYDEKTTHYNSTASGSSNWNSSAGYEQSWQSSREDSVTQAIKEQLSKTSEHSISKAVGGGESTTESKQDTFTNAEEYNTTFTYGTTDTTTSTQTVTRTFTVPGYYRYITAGTIHVYGVVGYDVATASYYTYCFNVLDDKTRQVWDYSKDDSDFEDCNNGVVTFDIPFEVNEYVAGMVGKTNGLEISYDGVVTGFEPAEEFEGTVVIPQYEAKNNQDGTYSAVKVMSFDDSVFEAVKDQVKVIVLPTYITEIPDNAFAGCTGLETVIAYGVTKIGDNAFAGCTSLKKFYVDNAITFLGKNAFEGVPEVAITAYDSKVADSAINCGAKKISLNISYITDSYADKTIKVPSSAEYFSLIGNGSEYSNVKIESEAAETMISNMVFVNNTGTPIEMTSAKVTFARMAVQDAPGFAVILKNDNVKLNLLGDIKLSSKSDHAIIGKSAALAKADSGTTSKLILDGNYLVCGEITNSGMVFFSDGEIKHLTEEEYEAMLTSSVITFDSNTGSVSETSRTVMWGQELKNLPVPTKEYHDFKGWYTESGDLVAEGTIFSEARDMTLYAHWEQKPLLGWTRASEVPEDAQIEQTKWTYKLTSYTTSNASSAMDGWNLDRTESAWGNYGSWSGWSTTPAYDSDGRDAEKKTEHTGYNMVTYNYRRKSDQVREFRSQSINGKYSTYGYDSVYSEHHHSKAATVDEVNKAATVKEGAWAGDCTYPGRNKGSGTGYILPYGDGMYMFFIESNINTTYYRYRDRSMVYTYYFSKVEEKESDTYPEGENISEVQEWVRYREK